ncbi:MAG TPA: hypothetical protein PLI98_16110 [Candidatus Hydrogenedentes bacterium]|nr:hypothetical protein [Candidatus Hydrogenedentota bacterium]
MFQWMTQTRGDGRSRLWRLGLCLAVALCWGGMTVWVHGFHHHSHCCGDDEEHCPLCVLLVNTLILTAALVLPRLRTASPVIPCLSETAPDFLLPRGRPTRAPPACAV